ncbi:CAMK family protein kinase [Tritrichomonas foetus]|uniref:CAMK family protein kinase n=1 Tax=Tritrichomonas foetus TaxID=1144522 RepID=A0A1J4JDN4_9EUKA|nr:CAMK family protein kinase [Tritrichomonas foetus]|eukprot:OHS95787.1 CAMK family protein kinase [Tritrichomonas foetus]
MSLIHPNLPQSVIVQNASITPSSSTPTMVGLINSPNGISPSLSTLEQSQKDSVLPSYSDEIPVINPNQSTINNQLNGHIGSPSRSSFKTPISKEITNKSPDEVEINDSLLLDVLKKKDYKYVKPIGRGGTATCHVVYSNRYMMNFVCKKIILDNNVICSQCELIALQKLNSSEIIRMYDFEILPSCIFLFLEYCPNGSLQDYIRKEGPLSGKKLYGVVRTLLNAIKFIHDNRFAHLDIKPSNILIDKYGRVKLADFGISRFMKQGCNVSNQRAGTIIFMPPELFTSSFFDPFSADIWSLGVTFYYLATKKVPWSTVSLEYTKNSILNASIMFPPSFNDKNFAYMIREMLRIDPKIRLNADRLLQMPFLQNIDRKDCALIKNKEVTIFGIPQDGFSHVPTSSSLNPNLLKKAIHPHWNNQSYNFCQQSNQSLNVPNQIVNCNCTGQKCECAQYHKNLLKLDQLANGSQSQLRKVYGSMAIGQSFGMMKRRKSIL